MKKSLASILLLSILSSGVYANSCAGNTCSKVKINQLFVDRNGNIAIETSEAETGLTCDALGNRYILIPSTVPGKNMLYSALLTAQTTKNEISIRTNSSGQCEVQYIF